MCIKSYIIDKNYRKHFNNNKTNFKNIKINFHLFNFSKKCFLKKNKINEYSKIQQEMQNKILD